MIHDAIYECCLVQMFGQWFANGCSDIVLLMTLCSVEKKPFVEKRNAFCITRVWKTVSWQTVCWKAVCGKPFLVGKPFLENCFWKPLLADRFGGNRFWKKTFRKTVFGKKTVLGNCSMQSIISTTTRRASMLAAAGMFGTKSCTNLRSTGTTQPTRRLSKRVYSLGFVWLVSF